MAYIVIKTIRGRRYKYWQRSFREGGRVRTQCRCLGRIDDTPGGERTHLIGGGPIHDLRARAAASPTFEAFVTKMGAPLYHGTLAEFQAFDDTAMGSNTGWDNAHLGIFFLEDRGRALAFANDTRAAGDGREAHIKSAWLLVGNPLDLTPEALFNNAEQAPLLVRLLTDEVMAPDAALRWINDTVDLGTLQDFYAALYTPAHKAGMIAAGYDGIISQFGCADDGTTIREHVVFSSAQVLQRDDLAALWRAARATVAPTAASAAACVTASRHALTNGTLEP